MAIENRRSLLLVVVATLLVGCGEEPKFQAGGKVIFDKRPVYPATLMFKDSEGKILPVNTANDGSFQLFDVRKSKYQVAVQTPKLAGVGGNKVLQGDQSPEAEGRREATVPDKFKEANTQIPAKYADFATSDLVFDFSENVAQDLLIELKN